MPMSTASLRSMTGFGESECEVGTGSLRVEIRTVNNRYLNVQFRAPVGMERHYRKLERLLRDYLARGQVNVSIGLDLGASGREAELPHADIDRARAYVDSLRGLQRELDLEGSIDIGVLARYRGLFEVADLSRASRDLPEELLVEAVSEAARNVVTVREEEGEFLRGDLLGRVGAMEEEIERVAQLAPQRLIAERDRLRHAIHELLDGDAPVDEERIAREIAHLAERWDIHEELVRFRSHLDMLRAAIEEGEPGGVGKRLSFIAQELLREANTIGSKANDSEIARSVVGLKEEIDRVREQVENVE